MDAIVLENIPFQIDIDFLMKRLRINEKSNYANELKHIAYDAQTIAKPKALYKVAFIESKGDDYVVVDGITLTSRVLRVNLDQAHRVFAFVATCGLELEKWANCISDVLQSYWVDTIKEMGLQLARKTLEDHLSEHHHPGRISRMNPGSLADWPIQQQKELFKILGNTEDRIGVRLTESLLMVPIKSVSGIFFPTEESFVSCQLCPREICPGRKAPYDKDLYDRKYRKTS